MKHVSNLSVIESLELRQLFHEGFFAAVNFQPISSRRPPEMLIDYGAAYDVRRGGLSYGWNTDQTANVVEHYVTRVPRNNTFINMPRGTAWEMEVPNGDYTVYVVSGDPAAVNERMGIFAEGELVFAGITRKTKPFLEGGATVTVNDGRLTLTGPGDFGMDKVNYLAIESVHSEARNLGITTIANADENGQVSGKMLIERSGDLSDRITVPLAVTGTATNSVDYGRVGSAVTFAAGVSQIELPIVPVVDDLTEGTESVTVTLGSVSGYTLLDPSATVTITDKTADPQPTNLAWSTAASRPVAASEIISAEVGGKLYTFGGFVDNTFHPTPAAYVYDPSADSWSSIAPLSVGLTHAGVAADNSHIYFAGGYPGNGSGGAQTFATTHVFQYTPATNSYADLPSLPVARGAGMLALLNNTLYFIAGDNSSRADVADVYALDLGDLNAGWTAKASLPAPRNHGAAIAYNGSIYVFGGQTGQDADLVAQKSLWRYDASSNAWTALADMPGARSHVTDSTFIYNGTIVALGGQSAYESPVATNVAYDPTTNTWSTLTSLPAARFSGAGHLLGNGKFYYTGGYNGGFKSNTYVGTWS